MSETSKAFLLSAISGIVAFGAAVLVLGGGDSDQPQAMLDSQPTTGLTRADVQAMLDSQPTTGLTRADVQAMLDSQPTTGLTRADVQAMLDSQPTTGLTRADVQAMLDSQPTTGLTRADVQAMLDSQGNPADLTRAQVQTIFDLIFDLYYAAHYFADCSDHAVTRWIGVDRSSQANLDAFSRRVDKCIADAEAEVVAAADKAGLQRRN